MNGPDGLGNALGQLGNAAELGVSTADAISKATAGGAVVKAGGGLLIAASRAGFVGSIANGARMVAGRVGRLFASSAGVSAAKNEVTVYRVFGGDSRAQGFSWTTRAPRTVANFRDAAGVPSGGASGANNAANFLIQGKVNPADIIKSRSALPLDGNKGGLLELIIDPKNVKFIDCSVLKP